jgi:hypothetical protein
MVIAIFVVFLAFRARIGKFSVTGFLLPQLLSRM